MAFFQVSSEQWNSSENGIFPLTTVDSQIIHKDCGGDLDQDIGYYVRENPVIPKSWKSLKALLLRDYCRDKSQPLTLTDGRISVSLPVYFNSFPVMPCPFLLFSTVFPSGLSDAERVTLLLQADDSLPVFRSQFLEHSSFFLVPVIIKGKKRGSRTKNIFWNNE